MTLEEAIAAFEKDMVVVRNEVGFADPDADDRLDMARAPNGDRYVEITSGGRKPGGQPCPAWFADEERAVEEWLRQAWSYADRRGGKDLYWKERPTYTEAEFIAVDQFALMNNPQTRGDIVLNLGRVTCRLVISQGETKKESEQ